LQQYLLLPCSVKTLFKKGHVLASTHPIEGVVPLTTPHINCAEFDVLGQ